MRRYTLEQFFDIIDDNIDEDEQSFAIVAEIGQDVPDGISCFQTALGETECFGRRGATQIRILDNDRKTLFYKFTLKLIPVPQLWSLDLLREIRQHQRA